MAKVVTEVALGAAAIAAPFVLPGLGVAVSSALTNALVGAGASMVLSGAMTGLSALGKNAGGIAETVTSPIGPWNYVYGKQVKVGGTKIFWEANNNTGAGGRTSNNKQLHMVIALACHPCAIGDFQLRIDGKQVTLESAGAGYASVSPTQLTPAITSISRSNNLVTVKVASGLPNANGTTIFTKNVTDNTYNGVWIITQPDPEDNTTFTFVCGGPDGSSSGGYLSTTYPDYKNKVYVEFLNGNHTSTFQRLLAAGTTWGPSDLCLGRTMAYVQLGYDQSVFPTMPNISFIIDGKNDILDPRTGTRGLTNNAALCIADYMAQPRLAGGFGLTIGTDIPATQLSAAANICDEAVDLAQGGTMNRYTCNTSVLLTETRGTILQKLLSSCAGRLSFQGGTWNIFPGAWVTPSLQLSDADLIGPIEWRSRLSIRETCNAVKGTYVSPVNDYQQGDWPAYMQDVEHGYETDQYLVEDNGERIFLEADLPCTTDDPTAQRLGKIAMMRTRYQGRGTLRFTMKAYQAVALDVIQFTHSRWASVGWTNRNLEVLKSRFILDSSHDVPTLGVELDVADTDASIFDWATSEQVSPMGYILSDNMGGTRTVSPPEALSLYSGPGETVGGITYPNTVSVGADGIKRNSLYVTWTAPNDSFVTSGGQIEVQYQLNGAPEWTSAGKFNGATTNCFINNVSDGLQYNVQIRAINVGGFVSEWVQAGPETLSSVTSSISASAISGLDSVAITGVLPASKVTGLANVAITGQLSATDIVGGILPSAVLPTALANLNSAGVSSPTVTAGAAAQLGAGATATVTGSGLAGSITLTTGTGTLAPGELCKVTFSSAYATAPNGVCAANGTAIPGLEWSTSTNTLTISATSALTPSTTYTIGYFLS